MSAREGDRDTMLIVCSTCIWCVYRCYIWYVLYTVARRKHTYETHGMRRATSVGTTSREHTF